MLVLAEELFPVLEKLIRTTTADPARPTKNITSSNAHCKIAKSISTIVT